MKVYIGDIIRFNSEMRDIAPSVVGKLGLIKGIHIEDNEIIAYVEVLDSGLSQVIYVKDIKEVII